MLWQEEVMSSRMELPGPCSVSSFACLLTIKVIKQQCNRCRLVWLTWNQAPTAVKRATDPPSKSNCDDDRNNITGTAPSVHIKVQYNLMFLGRLVTTAGSLQEHYFGHRSLSEAYLKYTTFWELIFLPSSDDFSWYWSYIIIIISDNYPDRSRDLSNARLPL